MSTLRLGWTGVDMSTPPRKTIHRTSSSFTPEQHKFLIRGCEVDRTLGWTCPLLSTPRSPIRQASAEHHKRDVPDPPPRPEPEASTECTEDAAAVVARKHKTGTNHAVWFYSANLAREVEGVGEAGRPLRGTETALGAIRAVSATARTTALWFAAQIGDSE